MHLTKWWTITLAGLGAITALGASFAGGYYTRSKREAKAAAAAGYASQRDRAQQQPQPQQHAA